MPTSRIFPLNWATGAGGMIDNNDHAPKAAMQSITLSLRFGGGLQFPIGYVQGFNWSMQRSAQAYHQIEAYPNGTLGDPVSSVEGVPAVSFTESTYWPGEPVEVIPGKVGGIEISLSKIAFYSANLLRSLLKIDGAGAEDTERITNSGDMHYTGIGQNEYVSLIQQVRPIYIHQIILSPTTNTPVFGRTFEECWFTNLSEDIPDASENRAVVERGTLLATRMRPYVKNN